MEAPKPRLTVLPSIKGVTTRAPRPRPFLGRRRAPEPPAETSAEVGTPTHCPYCALQCGMTIVGGDEPTIVARDFPTNAGGLCRKGWTAATLLRHPERLTTPLMRVGRDGPLVATTWSKAIQRTAQAFIAAQRTYGVEAAGVFGGGGLTNEKAYLLGKFARVGLRTPSIDYNGRFCMSSAAAAGTKAFGLDRGLPFPLDDIPLADVVILVGANPAETMPPIMRFFDEQRRRGGRLIVIDPRVTATARTADLHLGLEPGTDMALANGLLHILVRERMIDRDYIHARTTGFGAVLQSVATYWPDRVERTTGVPAEDIRRAAVMIGEARTAMVLTARGSEQHSKGTETVLAFINLMLARGQIGTRGGGYGCLTGQGNGQGGREHGQKADQLPGYRRIDDPAAREHVAGVWGVDPDELPGVGLSAYEMLDVLGTPGGVRALMVMGSNPVVSAPRAGHIQERFDALDFLAVADPFLSETAARADVVFPSTQWAEEDGTMTNLEGRVLWRRRAVAPPEGVRSDAQIIVGLAAALGRGNLFTTAEPREIFDELRRASAGGPADYAGITYERIATDDGVFWPCPTEDHPGTPRMFTERFATPDGRARFHAVTHTAAAEEPDQQFPMHLTTGRVMGHYQSGTQTRRVDELVDGAPEAFVEINPMMARLFGIVEGALVTVESRRGTATARAHLVTTIRHDTLFMPFHWAGEGRVNLLTNPALDPYSRMPEFKTCAVRIAPAPPNATPQGGTP
jgi:assimilatory nitrate reductase catalytic subunit